MASRTPLARIEQPCRCVTQRGLATLHGSLGMEATRRCEARRVGDQLRPSRRIAQVDQHAGLASRRSAGLASRRSAGLARRSGVSLARLCAVCAEPRQREACLPAIALR